MVGLTSCNDDEDDDSMQSIVGAWQSTHATIWNKINGVMDDESFDGPFTSATLTFYANGKFKMAISIIEDVNFEGTYKLSGNTLQMTVDGETEKINVIELSGSRLVIDYHFDDGIDDGEHLEGYMKLVCERVN